MHRTFLLSSILLTPKPCHFSSSTLCQLRPRGSDVCVSWEWPEKKKTPVWAEGFREKGQWNIREKG